MSTRTTSLYGTLTFACAALALTGCDWGRFDTLEDNAPVRVIEKPDDYESGHFGDVMTTYARTVGGKLITRLAVSAGTGTPTNVYPIFNGDVVATDPLFDACKTGSPCGNSSGSGLAGAPSIGEGQSCVVMGAREQNQVVYRCESGGAMGMSDGVRISGPVMDQRFGAALAPVPFGTSIMMGSVAVRAFVGAPGALEPRPVSEEMNGALYTIRDNGSAGAQAPLFGDPITDPSTGETLMALGGNLATARYDSTHTLLLATANSRNSAKPKRVVVFLVDNATASIEVRACLARTEAPITALTAGDFNGDGIGDIAISDDQGSPSPTPTVDIYDGRGLPDSSTGKCQEWGSAAGHGEPTTLSCDSSADVSCDGSGFGAALAAGDLNADGSDELIVSAPFAVAKGITGAGVAYVYQGGASGIGVIAPITIQNSDPNANGNFGRNLITFPVSATRQELVVAEGGGNAPALYVFLCSGVVGDTATPMSPQCQMTPVTP